MDWIEALAPVWVRMDGRTAGGDPERMVLFAGGAKVDFVFHEAADLAGLAQLAQSGKTPAVIQRGARVLIDKDHQIAHLLPPGKPVPPGPPSAQQFQQAWERFWFVVIYAVRQLRRGDLAFYKGSEQVCRQLLLPFLEWHTQAQAGWIADTWHNGRYAAEWLDPGLHHLLAQTYTPLEAQASWQGLLALLRCFSQAARGVAEAIGHPYPEVLEAELLDFISQLRPTSIG
jgi:aminoglycoside 6-adenylyltransferase